jgi:hypothetical protein
MKHYNDKDISEIAFMTEMFMTAAETRIEYSDSDIEAAIQTTWLPIFKTRETLALAINAVSTSINDESVSGLCGRYLDCLEAST